MAAPFAYADLAALLGAVLLAAAGGEAFLKAILGVAHHLRVPKAVAATTLAAAATSSPELTVSTVAALAGSPEIGLGDALGSNVVNVALIFGLALLFGPVRSSRDDFGRDFLFALAVPVLTAVLALDGRLSRVEGAALLALFALWLGLGLKSALRHRGPVHGPAAAVGHPGPMLSAILGVAGLAALMTAGRLFVSGATGIATSLGIDTYVIGAIVVAIGTSLPELVTVLLSRLRGHDEIGVGTLIGSNLFNGLGIVGVAASIHPIATPPGEIALTLGCGLAALLMLLPGERSLIPRSRAALLLTLYAGFVWATLAAGTTSY
jgi:cation:H+ antiporter